MFVFTFTRGATSTQAGNAPCPPSINPQSRTYKRTPTAQRFQHFTLETPKTTIHRPNRSQRLTFRRGEEGWGGGRQNRRSTPLLRCKSLSGIERVSSFDHFITRASLPTRSTICSYLGKKSPQKTCVEKGGGSNNGGASSFICSYVVPVQFRPLWLKILGFTKESW